LQLENEVPQARDRQLHRLLGLGQDRQLLGFPERASQHLQAHPESCHGLDGIVVNALGEAPAFLLAGCDEPGQQLVALRRGDRLDGSAIGRTGRGWRKEGAI